MTELASIASVDYSRLKEIDQDRLTEAVSDIAANRAVIEQAKGMLSVIYGITVDASFDLLRWRSQNTNTKLRALAGQLLIDFRSASTGAVLPTRSTYDDLLLTVHQRVGSAEPGG